MTSAALHNALYRTLAPGHLLTAPADCYLYSYDNSRYQALPSAVAFARNHRDVERVVKTCYDFSVPVVVRGKGTGKPGGAVPVQGGVVLSLEKMQKILSIDPANRMMRVQTGILNQTVQDAAAMHGFFWAPDPGNAANCTVGGNIGYNAAGPRAVKYGTTRENVVGLRAVIGTGETIVTGSYTTKGAVGYDLTRLLIGSEGTLAVITEATLKLIPLPAATKTIQFVYRDITTAVDAVTKIMAQPEIPCKLELLDQRCIQILQQQKIDLPKNAGALLLIAIDGMKAQLPLIAQRIVTAANNAGFIQAIVADTADDANKLWSTRSALSPALRALSPKKISEDVVMPVSRMPEFIEFARLLSEKYGFPIVTYGHAGNGNLHVNLMVDENCSEHFAQIHACLSELFDQVIQLGGTLSGEHGIGLEKRPYITRAIDPVSLNLMRAIKQQFDPKSILNPGKIF